jgi:signal peptidase I
MQASAVLPDALRHELAADTLRRFGSLALRVTGTSMLPAVRPGDIVHVRACEIRDVAPGDVVLFDRGGRFFAHRAVRTNDGHTLLTRGDAVGAPDPLVGRDQLLGKVHRICRRDRSIVPKPPGWGVRLAAALLARSRVARSVFCRALAAGA